MIVGMISQIEGEPIRQAIATDRIADSTTVAIAEIRIGPQMIGGQPIIGAIAVIRTKGNIGGIWTIAEMEEAYSIR